MRVTHAREFFECFSVSLFGECVHSGQSVKWLIQKSSMIHSKFLHYGGKNWVNFFENLVISLAVFFDGIGIDFWNSLISSLIGCIFCDLHSIYAVRFLMGLHCVCPAGFNFSFCFSMSIIPCLLIIYFIQSRFRFF